MVNGSCSSADVNIVAVVYVAVEKIQDQVWPERNEDSWWKADCLHECHTRDASCRHSRHW